MYQLDYPWLLALLPLPILIWAVLPPYREETASVRLAFFAEVAHAAGVKPATGGRYFFGQDQTQLEQIYTTLDRITPANQKTLSWRPVHELFYVPLGAAQALLFAYSAAMFLFTSIQRWRMRRAAMEAPA